MKNEAEVILDTVVWIADQLEYANVNVEEAPVLELAKQFSTTASGPPQSRTVPQELRASWRQRPAVAPRREKNVA